MKKSIKLMVVLAITLLILPGKIYAATRISVSCSPEEASPGQTVTCTLSGYSDAGISSISIPFVIGNATLVSYSKDNKYWNYGDDVSNNCIDQIADVDVSGNFGIGTFKLKINSNPTADPTIAFNDATFVGGDYSHFTVGSASKTIRLKSAATPTPTPSAKPTTTPKPTATATAKPTASAKPTAKPTTKPTATPTASPTAKPTNKVMLSDLLISDYSLSFDKENFNYQLTINDEDSLVIVPVVSDDLEYEIIGNHDLIDGSVITINVSDKNGNESTYFITVNRKKESTVIDSEKSKKGVPMWLIITIGALVVINILRLLFKGKKSEVDDENE